MSAALKPRVDLADAVGKRLGPEITDLIVDYDAVTLERRDVQLSDVLNALAAVGNRQALRIAAQLPTDSAGTLDSGRVDQLFVAVHTELQRLHEEFLHGERLLRLLRPLVDALLRAGEPKLRIVDVGCGSGFVVRWLAAYAGFDPRVELIGCDYNRALVGAAQQAAEEEQLSCRFVVGNAYELREPAHVYLSMGVLHHFRGKSLVEFFEQQATPTTQAFIHFDIAPTWLAPLGAWLFHRTRMRTLIARHDGVLSAKRAQADDVLLGAARSGASQLRTALFALPSPWLPVTRVIRPVVGIRPAHQAAWLAGLGPDQRLFTEFG